MEWTVTMFGKLADQLGREVRLDLGAGRCTLAELRRALADAYPAAAPDLLSPRLRACVNNVVVDEGVSLQRGDEVSLLPPVSGG